MKAKEIITILDGFANPRLIDSWDNTGFQIGDDNNDIKKIIISLDLDDYTLNKAIEESYDMIITHHPLIFKPISNINNKSNSSKRIMKLISNEIVVYNAHSNLDLANGGVNDTLAEILGIKDTKALNEIFIDNSIYGYGRIGTIDNMSLLQFIEKIKKSLCVDDIRVYGQAKDNIEKVAVCGGSGGDFILDAYKMGAQVYLTGDIKYHQAQEAIDLGLVLIDAGHFHTEKIILPKLKKILLEKINNIDIEVNMLSSVKYRIY